MGVKEWERTIDHGSVRFGSVGFGSVRFRSVRFRSGRVGSVRLVSAHRKRLRPIQLPAPDGTESWFTNLAGTRFLNILLLLFQAIKTIHMSSPVLHYELNDSDVGNDSSPSGLHMTSSNVTLVTDPERGPVASFAGNSNSLLTLPSSSVPSAMLGSNTRTVMFWFKISSSQYSIVHKNGTNVRGNRYCTIINTDLEIYGNLFNFDTSRAQVSLNTWHHFASTWDGANLRAYLDGIILPERSEPVDTTAGDFTIGGAPGYNTIFYEGYLSDFRVYDFAFSEEELLAAYQESSPASFAANPSSTLVECSWGEVSGATSYRLTYVLDGDEVTAVQNTSSLEYIIHDLTPDTDYTIRLYYSADGIVYTLEEETSVTTLSDAPENTNIGAFLLNGVYDLSNLKESTRIIVQNHLNDLLVSGDKILLNDRRLKGIDVSMAPRSTVSTAPDVAGGVLIPFDPSDGTGQDATLQLSDSTNVVISYEEASDNIVIDGVTYNPGDSFVLDGKKVTVYDV